MSNELSELRAEIERVLAAALAADTRHLAETERRDRLHLHEVERRDELHLHELEARSALHAREVENLREALASRDLLGQAKGVLMTSLCCSADDAFRLIVQQSQHENRKAKEIAAEIVERVTNRITRPSTDSTQIHHVEPAAGASE